MKKVLSLLIALLFVFTLTACTDDTALLDLTDTVNALQTQLNASDVSIEDLEDAKDALQLEVDALTADLELAKTANTDLAVEITDLQADLDDAQLILSNTIAALSSDLTDATTLLAAQLIEVADEFQLALDEANVSFNLALDESNDQIQALQDALADSNDQIANLLDQLAVFEIPIIYGMDTAEIYIYEELDARLKAFDIQEGDISDSVVMTSVGSFDEPGEYEVTYEATDSDGNTDEYSISVTVSIPDVEVANYLSGVDLSKLDTENKGRIFAALEAYLLENVYAGVPLYTGATRIMYADRVSLFSPEFNGVMGFGTAFSTFTEDDSNVLMYSDTYGNAGEYTWRASFVTDPTSLNPWTADDAGSSDFIDLFTGSLYTFYFDTSKTGYEINPDLASADPIPINPVVENGKTYATIWEIPVRDDLVWTYHEDTDTSGFAAGHEVLDAEDYLWTWKYALDNTWFRAISGGGDFITSGIKNAAEYLAGTATWEEVGLKVVDGNIQLQYTSDKSMFDIKYQLAGSWTPINQQLFEDVGALGYGLGPDSVAASGIYVFETWTSGQFLYFSKNLNHPHADMYNYTGQQFRQISDDEQRFAEFLEGRLESSAVPSARIDEFITDPRVKVSPANTTWRLMINGFGTEENRDAYIEQYPEFGLADDFVPEPILQYLEMKKALYYGFDRYHAAVEVVKTYLPAFTLFASTYFLDAEGGISVRGTEAGAAIVTDFGGGTYGFSPDAAVAYFKSAVAKGIADGYYTAGTPTNYTIIDLSLTYASSGNSGAQNMVAELVQQYESLLVDDENYVILNIEVADVAFPTNYYDFMMTGATDLGIGGISGSLMDAPSFLDVFNDDNVSGFTLNWGIDTHSVNIPVIYRGLDGKTVHELWSYNALVATINGKEYIADGVEQTVFDSLNGLIDAYIDMAGSAVASSTDGADLAQYVLGQTVTEMATAEGFDAVHAYIVVTVDGGSFLFVVSELDGGFELVAQHALATDARTAILNNVAAYGYNSSHLTAVVGPMTDADVVANAYLSGMDATITTVAGWAAETGAPAAYTELYETSWTTSGSWDDAFVVLHIGEYYIGWAWL